MKNKLAFALLAAFAAAGAMAAEGTDSQGVTTSTDPAKIAQVERHADELKAQQGSGHQAMAAHTSGTSSAKSGAHAAKHGKHAKAHRSGTHKKASAKPAQG